MPETLKLADTKAIEPAEERTSQEEEPTELARAYDERCRRVYEEAIEREREREERERAPDACWD